jgi:hypothetical protein
MAEMGFQRKWKIFRKPIGKSLGQRLDPAISMGYANASRRRPARNSLDASAAQQRCALPRADLRHTMLVGGSRP